MSRDIETQGLMYTIDEMVADMKGLFDTRYVDKRNTIMNAVYNSPYADDFYLQRAIIRAAPESAFDDKLDEIYKYIAPGNSNLRDCKIDIKTIAMSILVILICDKLNFDFFAE